MVYLYRLVTVDHLCQCESPSCSYIEVVADPAAASGMIEVVDCSFTALTGTGGRAYMNPDLSCPWCETPARETSRGQVKALYE